ncbi:MAG: DUF2190 family protein [Planctomycetota bacterium]
MKNYKGSADRLTLVAPAGGVVSGGLYVIGGMAVIAEGTAAAGELFSAVARGEFSYAKATGAVTAGARAFYDSGNDNVTATSASGRFPVGYFPLAAASDDTTVDVVLTGEYTAAV